MDTGDAKDMVPSKPPCGCGVTSRRVSILLLILVVMLALDGVSMVVGDGSVTVPTSASMLGSRELGRIVCCVSFWYGSHRVVHLRSTLIALLENSFPVLVYVVTNEKGLTEESIRDLLMMSANDDLFKTEMRESERGIIVVEAEESLIAEDPFKLTWHHRSIFFQHLQADNTTVNERSLYLYLEDDILVNPRTLLNWFESADYLFASLGLIQGFYRVDGDPSAPSLGMLTDQFGNCLEEVYVPGDNVVELPGTSLQFVQLWNTYSACYALTGTMLKTFAATSDFDLATANNPMGLEVRELAASGMSFLPGLSKGGHSDWMSATVVPWKDGNLDPEAAVMHLDVSTTEPNWCYVVEQERMKLQQEL